MKKNKLKYLKYTLIAAFIVACAALLYSFIFEKYSINHYENKIKNIENKIQKSQKKLEDISINLLEKLCNIPDSALTDELFSVDIKYNSNEGIFCLRNDSLIYWSSNFPIQAEQLAKVDTIEHFTNFIEQKLLAYRPLTERSYVTRAYDKAQFKIVYVIAIATSYSHQNDILTSGFDKIYDSESLFFERLGQYEGWNVCGKDGTPLFVLGIKATDNINKTSIYFRWCGAVLLLLIFIIFVVRFLFPKNILKAIFCLAIVFSGFMLLVYNHFWTFNTEISFFSSSLYASSNFLPSFGVIFLHICFTVTIIFVVFIKRRYISMLMRKINKNQRYTILTSLILFTAIQSVLCVLLPITLVHDSNFSLAVHKIYAISKFSIWSYFLMELMLTGFGMLQILCLRNIKSIRNKIIVILIQVLISVILLFLFGIQSFIVICFFVAYFIFVSIVCLCIKTRLKLKSFIMIVALSAMFCVSLVLVEEYRKTKQIAENYAESLSQKNDPTFETLFSEFSAELMIDSQLQTYVKDASIDVIANYLIENYFSGYFTSYDLELNLCSKSDTLFVTESDEETSHNCFDFFNNEKLIYGDKISELPLWFMSIGNGKVNYLIELSYKINGETRLFLNFTSRPESQYEGYPELLLDRKNQSNKLLQHANYSHARYFKNKLVSSYGSFGYNYELNISKEIQSHSFYIENNYLHYFINVDKDNSILVSMPIISSLEYFSSNSFVFLFFLIVLTILLHIVGLDILGISGYINFKQKTTILLLILVFCLLFVVGGTILSHTFHQFEENKIESIEEKIEILRNEFSSQHTMFNSFTSRIFSSWLVGLSNLYHIDINIYSLDGNLLSTSRPEIFDRKLLGKNINMEAFRKLNIQNQPYYIVDENIGSLAFSSIYFAFYNNLDEKLVYVNLPYFEQQRKFQEKWLVLANTIINIFIVVIILGILFATLISNLLSKPLDIVRSQMGQFNLLGKSEHIKYNGKDEIGNLVSAYNLMLDKLAESAAKLAQTERESAWREMAQQIAHEIKNPLTPMKLNIQHILRLKNNNAEGWENRLEESAKLLMEQINILSITASEFSNFAKLVNQERHDVDIVALLQQQKETYRGYENIKISLSVEGKLPKIALAVTDQLQRVLTNLIKNAIEAIGEDNAGEIYLFVSDLPNNKYYQIRVQDSGSGIAEHQQKHLFQPKFTTKSSGMGLGLAISKNMIESIGGRIYYSPTENGNTCFVIELPMKN